MLLVKHTNGRGQCKDHSLSSGRQYALFHRRNQHRFVKFTYTIPLMWADILMMILLQDSAW